MKDDGYAKCWHCREDFYAERKPPVVASTALFCGYEGNLDTGKRSSFEKIDRVLMEDLQRLKSHIAEFDCFRHAWAEIAANDNPPGRKSELRSRLEIMQGQALSEIVSAARRIDAALYPQNTVDHQTSRSGESNCSK